MSRFHHRLTLFHGVAWPAAIRSSWLLRCRSLVTASSAAILNGALPSLPRKIDPTSQIQRQLVAAKDEKMTGPECNVFEHGSEHVATFASRGERGAHCAMQGEMGIAEILKGLLTGTCQASGHAGKVCS